MLQSKFIYKEIKTKWFRFVTSQFETSPYRTPTCRASTRRARAQKEGIGRSTMVRIDEHASGQY